MIEYLESLIDATPLDLAELADLPILADILNQEYEGE